MSWFLYHCKQQVCLIPCVQHHIRIRLQVEWHALITLIFPSYFHQLLQTLWPYSWQEESERVNEGLWLGWSHTEGMAAGWGDNCHSVPQSWSREDTDDQMAVFSPFFTYYGNPSSWDGGTCMHAYLISSANHHVFLLTTQKGLLVQSNWSNQPSRRCFQSLLLMFCFLFFPTWVISSDFRLFLTCSSNAWLC